MPKKRLMNRQTRRHDETNIRSSQFCERILKCDSLSETAWLTNTPLNLCSLVIVPFNQKPTRVSGDSLVGPAENPYHITKCCYAIGRALIRCFNDRKACSSSNVFSNENENELKFADRVQQQPYKGYSIHLDLLTKLLPISQHTNGLRQKSCNIT